MSRISLAAKPRRAVATECSVISRRAAGAGDTPIMHLFGQRFRQGTGASGGPPRADDSRHRLAEAWLDQSPRQCLTAVPIFRLSAGQGAEGTGVHARSPQLSAQYRIAARSTCAVRNQLLSIMST